MAGSNALTVIRVSETRFQVILVVVVVLTFYATAFPGLFTEVFGRPLHVAAAALLPRRRPVRVVLQLAVVFGLTVAPGLLQAL